MHHSGLFIQGKIPVPAEPPQFHLLGKLRIVQDECERSIPPYPSQPLLALLLLRPQMRRREQLAERLFPGETPRKSRRRLSDALYGLRRTSPYLPIQARRHELWLEIEAVWVDVTAFLTLAKSSDPQQWSAAIALYDDDLLIDHFDDWILEEREILRGTFLRIASQLRDVWMEQEDYAQALALAKRLVREEPFDEEAVRRLMRIHQALGQRGEALQIYDYFVHEICPQLGIPPDTSTEILAHTIRKRVPLPAPQSSLAQGFDQTSDALSTIRAAILQGECASAEAMLATLKRSSLLPGAQQEINYLDFDVALLLHNLPRAQRALAASDEHALATLIRQGRLALLQSQWQEALAAANRALQGSHRAEDRTIEARALWLLASAHWEVGHQRQAYRIAEQALALAHKQKAIDITLDCLLLLGRMSLQEGRATQPGLYITEALSLARRYQYYPHYARALRLSAWLHSIKGRLLQARQAYTEALAIFRNAGMDRAEVRVLNELAEIHDLLGESRRSQSLLREAAKILARHHDEMALAINQYNQAYNCLYLGGDEIYRAMSLAESALRSFRAHKHSGWIAATLALKGYILWLEERFAESLEVLQASYEAHVDRGEWEMTSELLGLMAHCYLGMGKTEQALRYSEQAILALLQGARADDVKTEVYFAHALALAANGQHDCGRAYLRRAYRVLLETAARLEDDEARQALFRRGPITRRLMQTVYDWGIEAPSPRQSITRWLTRTEDGRASRVTWTIDAGPADTAIKKTRGGIAVRRARLTRLLREAEAQGATPKLEDLAEVLGVSIRTIQRDKIALQKK
ncbi:MAG: hypothetical protein GXP38_08545 [Chloroflexi bacterium]|nr:hypothetical protein [Chloroflexota bacterium]